MEEGDYLICKDADPEVKKNYLVQVSEVKPKEIDCVLELDRHLEEEEITVYPHHVLLNLGKRPKPELKTIAGVDVRDIFRKTINHDVWGSIHFLTKPEPEVMDALKKSLDKTGDRLSNLGFSRLFRFFQTEIRYQRGRHAGIFKLNDTTKKINRLQLFLNPSHAKEMNYVLYHEFGHAVRFLLMDDPRVHSSWISKFNTSVQLDLISKSEFHKMLTKFLKADVDKCSEFNSHLEEDKDKLIFKQAIRHISKNHRITAKEINSLLAAQKQDVIEYMWPDKDVDVNDLRPIVSEYAMKNVEELFAESFAFYMTKQKLPKSIEALMERSLSFAKDNVKKLSEKKDNDED